VSYRATLPKKVKPELMADRPLALQPHQGLRVLYAAGLWHELNRVQEAVRTFDPKTEFREVMFQTGTLGPELTWQPLLAEDLLGYDLVVLNNVGANALGEAGEIALQQYVKAGGSLLVCGGVYSLGKSRWDESELAEVLPLTTKPFFDLVRLPQFEPVTGTAGQPFTIQWLQQPQALQPGAQVVLRTGDHPLLVTGSYGKGKVAVWLGTPMGDPPPGVTPYWQSPNWISTLTTTLKNILPKETR
jgi:uncharacterized membrane protein